MDHSEIIKAIEHYKAIAILRWDCITPVERAAAAIISGGLPLLEISFTTPQACTAIEHLRKKHPRAIIGAGTVNTIEEVKQAQQAGAQFMFSPIFNESMVRYCTEQKIVCIPGVFTPTEVYQATRAGADFVKLFPANIGGPGYVKTLMAPLPQSRIIAVGGVNAENLQPYLDAGALAVGVAGSLFSKEDLAEERVDKIRRQTEDFMLLLNQSCQTS